MTLRPFLAMVMVIGVVGRLAAQAPTPQPAPAGATAPVTAAGAAEPQGFSYNAEGRRDPFVSLLRRGADAQRSAAGGRPAGLNGLSVSEVALKGTVASRGGFVAILQGVDSKTYIVREGEHLLDGTVRAITQDAMVLMQQVNDPLSLGKQREVRKVLRQTEEAK
jgi:Tfp pilus assembly protein PilP